MKNFTKICMFLTISLLFLVGCSTSNSSDNVNEENENIVVNTVMGDIEIPKNPERVVVNWYVGDAFTLDLNVIGYFAWDQETMPFYDKFKDSKKIENWETEDVMSLSPDLIITYDKSDFDKFNKIAPVLVITEDEMSAEDRLKTLGDATGQTEKAVKTIEIFEDNLEKTKSLLTNEAFKNKTFSIMEDWGPTGEWSGIGYDTGSRGGTLIYKYLNLQYPEKLQNLIDKTGETRGNISYEVAHEYFGDYILWFKHEGKESEYAQTDIWKSIPAVTNNNLVEIPAEYMGLFFYSDIASLTGQLNYMTEILNSLVM